jgi:pyridinium-3,5-biscarboxylic acid mononucleotide synthase
VTEAELRTLLEAMLDGSTTLDEAVDALRNGPFRVDRLPYATPDHHRALRQGLAEVVFGEGKDPGELEEIVRRLAAAGGTTLVTRVEESARRRLRAAFPGARVNEPARCVTVNPPGGPVGDGSRFVAVVAAGTTDVGVAEEAAEVCRAMRVRVRTEYDVGVSGLHRLLDRLPDIRRATAVVVVAGMEGALPSVVGGLVSRPVYAVPTSVGYGTAFGGVAALLAMLNSCAPGVAVFNIDNGFSAGIAAARVVLEAERAAAGAERAAAGADRAALQPDRRVLGGDRAPRGSADGRSAVRGGGARHQEERGDEQEPSRRHHGDGHPAEDRDVPECARYVGRAGPHVEGGAELQRDVVGRDEEAGTGQGKAVAPDPSVPDESPHRQDEDQGVHGDPLIPAEDARRESDDLREVEAPGRGDRRDPPGEPQDGALLPFQLRGHPAARRADRQKDEQHEPHSPREESEGGQGAGDGGVVQGTSGSGRDNRE